MQYDIRTTLNSLTKEDLISLVMETGIDRAFGVITRNMAETFYGSIDAGKDLIVLDICRMHAMNHDADMGYMDGVDERIKNVTDNIRHSDLVVRWGGDEILVILNSGDVNEYLTRLDGFMADNNMYAVYGVVKTSNSLKESAKRATDIIMAKKETMAKPDRDAPYVKLDSVIVYA